MKLNIKEDKQRLWFLIFAVCFTVLLLYIKFPSEAVTSYIRVQIEKSYPDFNIDFKKIGFTLSPGIKIQGLRVSLKEDPDTAVYASEKTSVRVSIPGWLKGNPKYYFESAVNGGAISGFIEEKNEVNEERIDATIEIEGVRLDEKTFFHPIISQRIEGIVTGNIKFMGNLSALLRGNTEISLDIVDGKIKILEPFLGMDRVEFNKINFSGVLDKRKLNIKDLNMKGGPLNASATGTIMMTNDILNSRLNLKAEIEPLPSLSKEMPGVAKIINSMKSKMKDGKLPFGLMGTLGRPSPIF